MYMCMQETVDASMFWFRNMPSCSALGPYSALFLYKAKQGCKRVVRGALTGGP